MDKQEQECLNRAGEAQKLMDNPLMQAFFVDLEGFLKEALWECPVEDEKSIRDLKNKSYYLKLFRQTLENYISMGKLIKEEINPKEGD